MLTRWATTVLVFMLLTASSRAEEADPCLVATYAEQYCAPIIRALAFNVGQLTAHALSMMLSQTAHAALMVATRSQDTSARTPPLIARAYCTMIFSHRAFRCLPLSARAYCEPAMIFLSRAFHCLPWCSDICRAVGTKAKGVPHKHNGSLHKGKGGLKLLRK